MAKKIAKIPLSNVAKIELYVSKCTKTLAQVKSATKADYVLNGGMWNSDGSPCLALKVDGKKLSTTKGWWSGIYGYAWNDGPDIKLSNDWDSPENYLSCSLMIRDGAKVDMSYGTAMGGRRGRTALGLMGDTLVMYASQDGSSDAKTPESLQTELYNMGCTSAIMLDSGGSSQCDFKGARITGDGRKCHNYICVYLDSNNSNSGSNNSNNGNNNNSNTPGEGNSNTMNKQYKITPSVGVNVRSGPGTDYAKVGAYSKGTVVTVTEEQNGWGKTTLGWFLLANAELVSSDSGDSGTTSDRVTDNGITITESFISSGAKNRPGGSNPMTCITIHETGNLASGADAKAHATYLKSSTAADAYVSWHYTVDDHSIYQHVPNNEHAYHAGDGKNGTGNTTSIGIEICVNADGDYTKAVANAAALVRLLKLEHSSIKNIYQHNHWTGKDCPQKMRATPGAWDSFLKQCEAKDSSSSAPDTAADWAQASWLKGYAKGITDGTNPANNTTRQEVMVYLDRLGLLD